MPSADKVVFVNTGTDAVQHALPVARAATGRSRVFKFHGHYHGWVGDWEWGRTSTSSPDGRRRRTPRIQEEATRALRRS